MSVMAVELMMKLKNSKLWVGVSTDFLSLMLNPKAWRRETVALTFCRQEETESLEDKNRPYKSLINGPGSAKSQRETAGVS